MRRAIAETLLLIAVWIEALAIRIGDAYTAQSYLQSHKDPRARTE